jgi:N-hydroxyarylamine O-acetyltransferase
MDLTAYLKRINYTGPLEPTAETLRGLHRAHMLLVPFENLDIHWGNEIVLDQMRIVSKIVEARRGGFCYELNGAFAALLGGLGFDVKLLSAAVAKESGGFGPPFDHLTLLVELNERWLADVGFGDSFVEPLLLDETGEQIREGRAYRISRSMDDLLLERREDELWRPQYRFTLRPYRLADFAEMCIYHQTSPDSPFTRKRVCTLATPGGRITLSEDRLIITGDGERSEQRLVDEAEHATALREYFGVERGF